VLFPGATGLLAQLLLALLLQGKRLGDARCQVGCTLVVCLGVGLADQLIAGAWARLVGLAALECAR
jgi:hypothetical protein